MNLYHTLEIFSFERIAFAHSLSDADYSFTLQNQGYGIYGEAPEHGGVLEIGFVEETPLIFTCEAGEFRIKEHCIFVIPPQFSFSVRAEKPGMHRHTSAEFLITARCTPADSLCPGEGKTVTLPLIIPPSPGSEEVFELIRSIAHARTAQSRRSYFDECADFMRLMDRLDRLVREMDRTESVSPGNRRYCDRAKAFVSRNIERRLTVREVADAVGISKNYLTNVFSSTEGMALSEYINRRKLSYMIELIRRYGYTLSQAGEHVGYTDVNYISRIFRRYYGMTVTEYKKSSEKENVL